MSASIVLDDNHFCCEGCKLVYQMVQESGLCNYYDLQHHPGLQSIKPIREEKFAFLDEPKIADRLSSFTDGELTIVTLYLPGVHCSSCVWLLENLHKLNSGILDSRLDFSAKELTVRFRRSVVSLRGVAELLATIGYEPQITLESGSAHDKPPMNRMRLYRTGVAAFCFSFIMMLSFPEYFGGAGFEERYAQLLHGIILALSVPVYFFSAGEFFGAAWAGLKAKSLNIDAPIALAITITYARSLYELFSGTGSGYLDSMSGIVFFMLIGRLVQERTYRSLSFHRDYQSYFPLAVTVLYEGQEEIRSLHELQIGDIIRVHAEEIIPGDAVVLDGAACIDYSFVTGESEPVVIPAGGKVFAGGRQTGGQLVLQLLKPVAESYLTSLWNNQAFKRDKAAEAESGSAVHRLSRHFTIVLFSLVAGAMTYWLLKDSGRTWQVATSMLIVACPCALLLSATFTNANLMRIFSNAGMYLRDATVLEQLAKIDTVIFDKTGTITSGVTVELLSQDPLTKKERRLLYAAVAPSRHPYSRALRSWLEQEEAAHVSEWTETPGQGIAALVDGLQVLVGNAAFTGCEHSGANVYAVIDRKPVAFLIHPEHRSGLAPMLRKLGRKVGLGLLSGDQPAQEAELRPLFGPGSTMLFEQQPVDKLGVISSLQREGKKVLMIGDGLNDAGALQQSDVGITLVDDVNTFTPACDAILDARSFTRLPAFMQLARFGQRVIQAGFAVSLVYNVIGLSFAASGGMNPMIAAILMPASTLSIVLISTGLSSLAGWRLGLRRIS